MLQETKVSLVDDHILLRTGLASMIQSFEGFTVISEADNGQEFIDQVKKGVIPDIVLLDITMPIMDGFETAEWIKNNLPDMKICVLSMMDEDYAIIKVLKLGAKGYLLKDSKPSIFKIALQNIRDTGFYINDLISNKMFHYVSNPDSINRKKSLDDALKLSQKEIQFLRMLCTDMTHKEIANELFVSPRTIDSYRDNLFEKTGVNSRVGLVLFAIKNKIINI